MACAALVREAQQRWRVHEKNYQDDITAVVARPRLAVPFATSAARRPLEEWLDAALAAERRKATSLQKEAENAATAEALRSPLRWRRQRRCPATARCRWTRVSIP